jgi:SAM-dependent methyltransferase
LLATEGRQPQDLRIYAPEAVTPLALMLRGRYARFVGSEFSEDEVVIENLFPIRFESLLQLSFTDGVFDVVIVNDVFEHVPDINLCLSELARVTRPGGHLISTFPFTWKPGSTVKARLQPEGIEYLTEPEYHENPVDPNGSLVFEIPGWNILDRARDAGWTHVEMVYHTSVSSGILGSRVGGIVILVAKR